MLRSTWLSGWYDKQSWWNFTAWKIGSINIPSFLSIALCAVCFIAIFLIISTNIITPSKKFSRNHRILSMPISAAIGACIEFIFDWVFIPVLDKIIFLFTPVVYKKKVLTGVEDRIHTLYKSKIKDFEHQVNIITDDRDRWRKAFQDQEEKTEKTYWDGAKRGFSLGEKRKSKDRSKEPEKLTEAHIFALREIFAGNKSINGFAAAYLEDHGYIRSISDNKGITHYESTTKGVDYLHQYAKDLLKKLDA